MVKSYTSLHIKSKKEIKKITGTYDFIYLTDFSANAFTMLRLLTKLNYGGVLTIKLNKSSWYVNQMESIVSDLLGYDFSFCTGVYKITKLVNRS